MTHPRRPPRRARPRAAPGRRGAAGAGAGARRRRAPARPGRSPTGSPTASPPASTTRPRCSRSPSRPAPRARCAAGCAGSAPAGCRRAPSTPPRCASCGSSGPKVYGGELPDAHRVQDRHARGRRPPAPGRRRPGAAARPGLRDRVGQGQQRPPRRLRRGRARPRPLGQRPRPRDRRPGLRDLRGGQARPGPDGHGGRAAAHRRAARRGRAGRRPGPPAVQVVRRRRVPGRLARSSPRCSTCGSAAAHELCVVGDPAQTIYSFAGANARYLRDFPASTPAPRRVELVRNYRSTPEVVDRGQHAARRHRRARASSCAPSGPPARRSTFAAHPDEVAEAEAVADADRRRCATQGVPLGEIAVLFRINAQSEAFEEALAERAASPTSSAAPPGSSSGRRCARRSPCCAARPAPARAAGDVAADVRGDPRRHGLEPRAPRRPAARPATAGSRCRRWSTRRSSSPPPSPAPTSAPSSTSSTAGPPSSTPRSPTASPWPPCTPPRAWSGTPSSCAGLQEGTLPIIYAEAPGRGRGGAPAALRRHDPRPARTSRCPGRWPATPAAGRPASPRRFLDGLRPADERLATGAGAGRGRRRGAVTCRECGKPLATGAEKKIGRCADCPASYDEELFERLRAWRLERAADEKVPAFVVFTDATLQLIAEHKPRPPRPACCASTASGGPSWSATASDVLSAGRTDRRARKIRESCEKYSINRLPITRGAR